MDMNGKIKTRFAPSPTGDLHIGSLRTALFAYLFARKNNGEFILRIEDTDQTRFKEDSLDSIMNGLKWAGIDWDNEELVFQSSRKDIYKKYVQDLIEKGQAYHCFCTAERLTEMREKQKEEKKAPKYDRHCLNLSQEEINERLNSGEPYVVRLKMPDGETNFSDTVRGEMRFDHREIDDQVLLKSDGMPTYHLANVVDDHEMEITHVIRAEEWLPSTPKHIVLYQMFGWEIPQFVHIPMVLAPDKTKLSKRHGATSVLEFQKLGYLPEALVNFIALLGWNPGSEREFFSIEELSKEFSLEKVQKAGAVFDTTKLDWMNAEYLKKIDVTKLLKLAKPFLEEADLKIENVSDEYLIKVLNLEKDRIKKLSDLDNSLAYFFEEIGYETELLKWKKSDLDGAKSRLELLLEEFEKIADSDWNKDFLENLFFPLIKERELGNGDTLWPLRVALSGQERSPSPFELAEIFGKEKSMDRARQAIGKIKVFLEK
jgi:glutamyl-tRNA synthetase